MSDNENVAFVGGLLIGIGLTIVTVSTYTNWKYHAVLKGDWQCTQSRVIKDTLPRSEECTQYTKKESE